ncbi:hypothetical protein [Lysobacter cavernae]|uniref:hypothetical protein n=1 Tax=Lysobacter cavernae TaxID=1685901 RepID=UPI0036DD0143
MYMLLVCLAVGGTPGRGSQRRQGLVAAIGRDQQMIVVQAGQDIAGYALFGQCLQRVEHRCQIGLRARAPARSPVAGAHRPGRDDALLQCVVRMTQLTP